MTTTHGAESARAIGSQIAADVAAMLVHDAALWAEVESKRPTIIRGVVRAVRRDSAGTNQVQITRTGGKVDQTWYEVYGVMFVPIAGDDVTLLRIGGTSYLVIGARHGGRPNEHTVAYPGGGHKTYDSARALMATHTDDHAKRHYDTDGVTVRHHAAAAGAMKHADALYHSHGGINDDGTDQANVIYHKLSHNAALVRHEHAMKLNDGKAERLMKHISATEHGDWTDDGTGTGAMLNTRRHQRSGSGGQDQLKQHGYPAYHLHGDDGTGKHAIIHASGNRIMDHDGTTFQAYAVGVAAHIMDGVKHYLRGGVGANIELARIEAAGAGATGGGRVHVKQLNSAATHVWGDDGTNKVHMQHASGNRIMDHDGNLMQHYAANGQVVHAHDGVNHYFSTYDGAHWARTVRFQSTATGAGQVYARQNGGVDIGHLWGDDGAGKLHVAHAQGTRVLDHDGATWQSYAAGGVGHIMDGVKHYLRGGVGANIELARIEAAGAGATGGGRVHVKQLNSAATHVWGDDGTGKVHIQHASGFKVLDHDGNTFRSYALGALAATHDGTTHKVYGALRGTNEAMRIQAAGGTNGVQIALGAVSSTAMHLFGEDGAGKVHIQHANGSKVLDHDGYAWQAYAANGHVVHIHDGASHIFQTFDSVNWTRSVKMQSFGTGAGQLYMRQNGYSEVGHIVGEDGAGNLQAWSLGGYHYTKLNNGASQHALSPNGHSMPNGVYLNAPSNDSSRVDIKTSGGGAIKAPSHSLTIVANGVGATIPTGGGYFLGVSGNGAYDQPHFKITNAVLWYGSNDGSYRHGTAHPSYQGGFGTDTVGTSAGNAFWSDLNTFGDYGVSLVGKTVTGAAWSGTATVKYTIVNV